MINASSDLDFFRVDPDAFSLCPEDSIDYAVMEKTKDALVVRWMPVGMILDLGHRYGM